MELSQIILGSKVRDRVTAFEGTAISRITYINGCVQYGVLPKVKEDGKYPETQYIDWQRLQALEEPPGAATGGPQRDAPRGR